ncbi:ABC transporter substrate-binding protein [Neoroseomonas oryzicola]|uniref:ABC transporter substrate-binding protein n=1 Tax=Neoroseomonas oryzicola TaxID=535904 RepID=A0A9X9WG26_9PROT|nr:ABC transporter substrate-binding protein [Neoroseomonas oryzicola]MBR0659286.1 ABC transporter substrate-binding protein [Neoroseomonas oryzicola]NKE15580.1 ABC transporter substrate-binding protein [Neoroseomonas oryzicola]
MSIGTTSRRSVIAGAAATAAWGALPYRKASAQAANTIKIGVLNDGSGMYRDISGPTAAACARQAVADFGARGFNVEVLVADHQNKPDVGSNIARQWIDRDGVDVLLDVTTSSVALAVNDICREKNKVHLNSSAATSDLTGRACTPNTIHWTYDTWMLAKSTGGAMVRAGGDTWFFITADYAFGHALERDTGGFVRAAGGRVLGQVRTPFPGTTDFSSFLVQAQASRAKVIGLANAGSDTTNCIKQAAEFGLTRRGIKIASLLMFLNDVHALGLQTAQGLVCTETFYWDLNDRTRRFTDRVRAAMAPNMPCMTHAGCYAGVLHYLKAVQDMGVTAAKASGVAAVERMKAMPTDDDCFGAGTIRADGRKIHPSYLFEVKTPAESRGPWDYYKLLQTTPADEAFRPVSEGGCSLIRS